MAWHRPMDPQIYSTAWHGKSWHGIARKIHRALAQGVSDHQLLDSNKEQHSFFFAGLIPKWTIFKSTINIEPQLLQLLLFCCCCCCCSNCCFLFKPRRARGGCEGASVLLDRLANLWRVTFFLHQFLGILCCLILSYFVQNLTSNGFQNGVHF